MATAELAMVSLVVAAVAMIVAWLISMLMVLNLCQITANEVARQDARGDRAAARAAERDAPRGAQVLRRREGKATVVQVTARAGFGELFTVPVSAQARVLTEGSR